MKSIPPFKIYGVLLLLSFMVLSACHGGGGGSTPAPLPTTVMIVGAPITDTVVRSTFNAYSAAVTPGSLYKISITGLSDDVDLNVYDTDSTFTHPISCPVDNGAIIGISAEDCILIPAGNTLYFGVDGSVLAGSAAVYTIDVELLPEIILNLSIPVGDQTTQRGAAAYSVLVPPGDYTVSTTGLSDDVDLHVFIENGFVVSPAVCTQDNTLFIGKASEDCTLAVNTTNSAVLFVVDGIFSSAFTVQYTALVTPAPVVQSPVSQGTVTSPIVITADKPTTGQVGPAGTSRYEVDNLTAAPRYTISITSLTDNADLTIFGDNTFTTRVGCLIGNTSLLPGTTPESCTFLAPPGGTVFFEVSSVPGSVNGTSYTILVEPGP